MKRLIRKLRASFRVASLGASLWQGIRLFVLSFVIALRARLKQPFRSYRVRLRYRGDTFSFVIERMSDFAALREVFLDQEYDVPEDLSPKVIVDIGSNVGASVLYFALRFSKSRIIAVEPDPRAFRQLQENTKQRKNISLVPKALSGTRGEAVLHIQKKGTMGSSLQRRNTSEETTIVQTETMQGLMRVEGLERIDLLKFDVEGAEERLFHSSDDLNGINALIGEVHLDLISISQEEFLSRFQGFAIETRPVNDKRFIMYAKRRSKKE